MPCQFVISIYKVGDERPGRDRWETNETEGTRMRKRVPNIQKKLVGQKRAPQGVNLNFKG